MIVNPPQYVASFTASISLTNPGFETGDFTGWINQSSQKATNTITAGSKRSGSYGLQMHGGGSNDTYQLLSMPIPEPNVTAFQCYFNPNNNNMNLSFLAIYEDSTFDGNTFNFADNTWHLCDLMPFLATPTKNVKYLGISVTGLQANTVFLDDFLVLGTVAVTRATTLLTYQPQS